MSLQDVFNKVWERAKIKERCESEVACLYRNPDGSKNHCFVGVCIPDELYDPKMDEVASGAITILNKYPKVCELFNFNEAGFILNELQAIHDYNDYDDWDSNLREFAYKYKLTIPENKYKLTIPE